MSRRVAPDAVEGEAVSGAQAVQAGAPDGAPPDPPLPHVTGPPRLPRRYVYYAVYGTLALLLVFALGAFLINRFASTSTGSSTPSGTVRAPTAGTPSGTAPPVGAHELGAPLAAFIDLSVLHGTPAPAFTLTDAKTGAAVSLSSLSGHVVVLTFADASCDDICPVLAAELHQASSLLGATKVPVTFVTINTDPLDTKIRDVPITAQPQLSALPHWRFLTGTLRQLDPVWKAYGVSITVDETSRRVSHDDPLYFVSRTGKLRWSATVFGDETKHGRFTLPAEEVTRYAEGVARYADELAGRE